MKREDHRQNRRIVAFAAFVVIALSLALPLLLAEDPTDSILRGSSVKAAGQGSFTLSQPIELLAEPRIVVARGTVSVAQPQSAAPLTSRALAKLLKSRRGVLILQDAEIFIGGDGKHHEGASKAAGAPLARALAEMKYQALLIERSSVEIASERGAPTVLRDVRFRLHRVAGERYFAKGSVDFLGREVAFDTTISARASHWSAGRLPIRGSISAASLFNASFAGQFAPGDGGRLMAGTSRIEVTDVPVLARWLGLSWPSQFGLKTFKSEGELEWARQILNVAKGTFQFDGNSAAGSLLVNGKSDRPLIDGTLAFDRLDVGALMKLEPRQASLFATTVRQTTNWLPPEVRKVLSEISLPILRELDVDLRISAETAVFSDFSAQHTAAALSVRDGHILVDLAEMKLPAGGHGSLQLTADTNKPVTKCGLRGSLKGVRFEDLGDLVFPHKVIIGPADVTLDLSGDWDTPETFVRNLDGRFDMRMSHGASIGADLPLLVESVNVNDVPKQGWGDAAKGRTGLESVTAAVVFENGVARIEHLLAQRHGRSELAVTGSFNIHRKSLDLNIFPRTKSESANEVPSVLNISGRWNEPMLMRRPFPNKAQNPLFKDPVGTGSTLATRG